MAPRKDARCELSADAVEEGDLRRFEQLLKPNVLVRQVQHIGVGVDDPGPGSGVERCKDPRHHVLCAEILELSAQNGYAVYAGYGRPRLQISLVTHAVTTPKHCLRSKQSSGRCSSHGREFVGCPLLRTSGAVRRRRACAR